MIVGGQVLGVVLQGWSFFMLKLICKVIAESCKITPRRGDNVFWMGFPNILSICYKQGILSLGLMGYLADIAENF